MATTVLRQRARLASKRRLDALLEILAGYAILVVLNTLFWPDDLGWIGTQLHPYFIVVLLIAGRYGTIDGLVAGAVGALLHVVFHMVGEPSAFATASALLDPALMVIPFLLLLLGTILGEIRQIAEDEIEDLHYKLMGIEGDLSHLSGEAATVRQYNESLQERIASSTQTTGAFYEAAANVQSLNEDEALPAVLAILEHFVGAQKSAIYVLGPDGWELRLERGWESPDEFDRTLPISNRLLSEVSEGRIVSIVDTPDISGSEIVMAAPLHQEDPSGKRHVRGAITVQDIPLSAMNAGTIRNLSGVAHWASQVLSAAERYERVRERDPTDEATSTYRYAYMMRRLEEECGRWRRYHTPVTLLLMRVHNYERVPRRKRVAFLRRAGRVLGRNIRTTDLVSRWKAADTLAVTLPATAADGARILASRISEQFQREVLKDVPRSAELALHFGVGTSGEHGDSREELVRAAERMEIHG